MEFDKNCIKMEEKSMSKYLEETVVDSTGWILLRREIPMAWGTTTDS